MYPIAAVGLLTVFLSCLMIASPSGWSSGILAFSQKPFFHAVEVSTRLALGGILITFADQTRTPALFTTLGQLMFAVGVGLVLAGARRHRAFAVRAATYRRLFRPAGFVSLAFGAFVIDSAIRASK